MADGIRAMTDDLRLMAEPESCLIVFTARDPKKVNCFFLAELMKRRGWFIQPQLEYRDSPPNIHLSCNPRSEANAPKLLSDLAACVAECKAAPRDYSGLRAQVQAQLDAIDGYDREGTKLTRAQYEGLLKITGLNGTDLPERMDDINEVLSMVPHGLRVQVLKNFLNDLFIHDEVQAQKEAKEFEAKKIKELKAAAMKYGLYFLLAVAAGAAAFLLYARWTAGGGSGGGSGRRPDSWRYGEL